MQNIRAGKLRALDAAWDRHARLVLSFALGRCRRREDAEEIVQDVFVTLWRRRDEIVLAGPSLLPWLLVTCKNLIANKLRRLAVDARRLADAPVDDTEPDKAEQPDVAAERSELRHVVSLAVAELSELDQELFRLCLIEGQSYDDAARELGLTNASVRNRLSRLRSRLRSELTTLRGTQ